MPYKRFKYDKSKSFFSLIKSGGSGSRFENFEPLGFGSGSGSTKNKKVRVWVWVWVWVWLDPFQTRRMVIYSCKSQSKCFKMQSKYYKYILKLVLLDSK